MDRRLTAGVFSVGFAAMLAQVLMLRELIVAFCGNELVLGIALACWLFWTGLGSLALSRLLAPRGAEDARGWMAIALAAAGLALPIAMVIVRLARPVMGIEVTAICGVWPALAASLVSLADLGLLFGLLFPLSVRAAGSTGRVYVLEAAGAAAAGLGYTLVLSRIGHPELVAGCVALGTALVALLLLKAAPTRVKAAVLVCLACSAASFLIPFDRIASFTWKPLERLETVDSRYARLVLTASGDAEAPMHSLFINGLLAWSWPDPPGVEALAHYSLLQCESPRRVLLIGGGAGGTADEILKHPVERLVYVELDPAVIDLGRRRLPSAATDFLRDSRVEVIYTDARRFVKTTGETFDAIIVALPRPYTAQLNRFYTEGFFREAAERLDGRGVLCFSVGPTPPAHYSDPMRQFLACLDSSLRTAFGDVIIIPGTSTMFVAAKGEGVLMADPTVLAGRLTGRKIATRSVAPYEILDRMADFRLDGVRSAVAEAGEVRINTDLSPVCYYYDAVLWSSELSERGAGRPLIERVEKLLHPAVWIVVAAGGLLLAGVGIVRRNDSTAIHAAVAGTGFIEILMEICCLLLLQSLFGFVYEMIGAVLFSFMLGLTAGGRWATRAIEAGRWGRRQFVAIQAAVVVYPLMLCAVAWVSAGLESLPGIAAAAVFCCLTFVAGLIGGLQFPLAVQLAGRPERAPARLYGLDLLGSCAGALIVSSLLLPVIGIPGSLMLASGLGAAVLAGILAGWLTRRGEIE